ncbi:ferric reductase NAD binding domain-containing protein [Dipodascopsis uninucleata]
MSLACRGACLFLTQSYNYDGCGQNLLLCCESSIFVQSYALCISYCDATAKLSAWDYVKKSCGLVSCASMPGYEKIYGAALEASVNETSILKSQQLSSPVRISQEIFDLTKDVYINEQRTITVAVRISVALIFFWIFLGTIALAWRRNAIRTLKKRSLPTFFEVWIQRRLITPSLFKSQHYEPLMIYKFPLGILPLRWEAMVCTIYMTLNFIAIFASLPIVHSSDGVISITSQRCLFIAKRSGVIAVAMIIPTIQFAGRNTTVSRLTGWDLETIKVFHKSAARICFADSLIHTFAISFYLLMQGGYSQLTQTVVYMEPNFFGVIAFIVFGIIILQSLYVFRRLFFEIFHLAHLILAIIFIVCVYVHVSQFSSHKFMIIVAIIVVADFAMRMIRILFGSLSRKAILKTNASVTNILVKPLANFTCKPGLYAYLYVLRFNFWQSHPFSVVEARDNTCTFIAKSKNGMTAKLYRYVVDNNNKAQARIWIEGPYGCSYPLELYDQVLLLSGGAGITASISYALHLTRLGLKKKISLHWVVRTIEQIHWIQEQLEDIKSYPFIDIDIYISKYLAERVSILTDESCLNNDAASISTCITASMDNRDDHCNRSMEHCNALDIKASNATLTADNIIFHYQKPEIEKVVWQTVMNAPDGASLAVFTCGPSGLVDQARSTVVDCLTTNRLRLDYYETAYS